MKQEQFEAIMPYISTDLVAMISTKDNISLKEALDRLYSSKLYELLEDEETKIWCYSTEMLYSLYLQGHENSMIEFPDI